MRNSNVLDLRSDSERDAMGRASATRTLVLDLPNETLTARAEIARGKAWRRSVLSNWN